MSAEAEPSKLQPSQNPPPPVPVADPKATVEIRPQQYGQDGQPVQYVRDTPLRTNDGR